MKKYKLLVVPSELGAGTRGAGMGIEALKVVARDKGDSTFAEVEIEEVADLNHLLDGPYRYPFAKYAEGIAEVGDEVCQKMVALMKDQGNALVLSGDHSMAFATIAGLKTAYPEKTLGIVWVDAHADLHSPYTSPTGNMHGMPLAMAAAEDNRSSKVNDPAADALEIWERLKNLGVKGSKYRYPHLFYIGVRSVESPEVALLEKHKITNLTVEEFRSIGVREAVHRVEAQLANCDLIYVSFDVDSMDPSISRGTGTPVEGGLEFKEALDLNVALASLEKVVTWEMVEINPTLDSENAMAKHAYDILKPVLRIFKEK